MMSETEVPPESLAGESGGEQRKVYTVSDSARRCVRCGNYPDNHGMIAHQYEPACGKAETDA